MDKEIDKKGITCFLLIAFIPNIALSSILNSLQDTFADKIIPYNSLFLLFVMFFPGISALIVRKFINKESTKNKMMRWGSWKSYLKVALFIPFLYIITYAITGLLYPPDITIKTFLNHIGIEKLPLDPYAFILVLFIFTLVIVPLINFIPALGEEYGWRGYLLPELLPLGRKKALITSGLIWGLWHLPFIFLIDYKSYPNKIAGSLVFTALITILGIYIGALALQHKSIFLASFMHGVVNAQDHGIWTIIYPDYNPLIGGGDGLIALIILLPVALYYLRNTRSCSFL